MNKIDIPWSDLARNQQRKCNTNPNSLAWWIHLEDGRLGLRIDFSKKVTMDLKPARFAGGSVELKDRKDASTFLLFLNEKSDKEVFTKFCMVLLNVPLQDNAQRYADSLLSVLLQWIRFLQKVKDSKGLDIRRQLGLFGELSFLKNELHINRGLSYSDALRYWVGPEKAPNDFVLEDKSYEIKCHFESEDIIRISNEQQLLYLGKPLFLVTYSVNQNDNGKDLSDFIQEIHDDIIVEDASLLEQFNQKLFCSGYNPAITYSGLLYLTTGAPTFYKVTNSFPHVYRADPGNAISGIKYDLSLTGITGFVCANE